MNLDEYFPLPPWAHQERGLRDALSVLKTNSSVVLCAPCGAGKTNIIGALLRMARKHGRKAVVYTFRRLLVSQMAESLTKCQLDFGVRSAAHKEMKDLSANIQLASIFTDMRRIQDQGVWGYHDADLVIIDEAHMGVSENAVNLIQHYLGRGSKVVAFTATPASLSHIYSKLVMAGTKKELRACGAHVPARVFAPHQMDLRRVRRLATGEFDMQGVRKHAFNQAVVGRLFETWKELNPFARQTLHFPPGVKESEWVAELFWKKGVSSAHIDSSKCWINGKMYGNTEGSSMRSDLLDMWDEGKVIHVSNHSVLKEGIDRPNIYCLMLSRPIGNVCVYDQITGRLIRASKATPDEVVMLDFAGNYDRHGSPNKDRDWEELFSVAAEDLAGHMERVRKEQNQEKPVITCVECGGVREGGFKCPHCGAESTVNGRKIIQEDGRLVEVDRLIEEERLREESKPKVSEEQRRWDKIYFSLRNSRQRDHTFKAASAIYNQQYGEPIPDGLRRIPKNKADWDLPIKAVKWGQLT